jgi:hypothetical protein
MWVDYTRSESCYSAASPSRLRQRYQLATEHHGRHARAIFSIRSGFGSARHHLTELCRLYKCHEWCLVVSYHEHVYD